jgi:hypothetical protein
VSTPGLLLAVTTLVDFFQGMPAEHWLVILAGAGVGFLAEIALLLRAGNRQREDLRAEQRQLLSEQRQLLSEQRRLREELEHLNHNFTVLAARRRGGAL